MYFSNPEEIRKILKIIDADKYEHLQGLNWFKLPRSKDQIAWSIHTLNSIMGRREQKMVLRSELTHPSRSVYEVVLSNTGESEIYSNIEVDLEWQEDIFESIEMLGGFDKTDLPHPRKGFRLIGISPKPGQVTTLARLNVKSGRPVHILKLNSPKLVD